MKAVLQFNLDDSDDSMNHYRAIRSLDMALFIYEMANQIRELTDTSEDGKYIDEKHLWKSWEDLMQKYNLDIDKLVI